MMLFHFMDARGQKISYIFQNREVNLMIANIQTSTRLRALFQSINTDLFLCIKYVFNEYTYRDNLHLLLY